MSARARQVLLAAGAFAGGAALAVPLVLPELVRRRIVSALEDRTSCEVQLSSVALGMSSVSLEGLAIQGRGLDVLFDHVDVTLDALGAAFGDLSSIEHVSVRGGHVTVVPFASEDADAVATSADAPRRTLPSLALEGVSFALDDDAGALVRASQVTMTLDEGALDASAESIRIEGGPPWSIDAATVVLRREEARARVARVTARDADLRVAADESARLTRLRDAWHRVQRLRGRAGAEGEAGSWLDRLTADFSLELTHFALAVEREGEGTSASLSGLSANVTRREDHFRTEGSARPGETGRLGWNLDVEPEALLASGSVDLDGVSLAVLAPFLPSIPFYQPARAEVSGSLVLDRADLSGVRGSGTLSVVHLGFSHPRLSAEPVREISLTLRGAASWAPIERQLTIEEIFVRSSTLGSPGAEVRISGTALWQPERYALDVVTTLPRTSCENAIHAIPTDLMGGLEAMSLTGTIGGSIELAVDSDDLDATRLRIRVADQCSFVSVPLFADPARFDAPFHHRAVENDGDVFEMETGPGTLAWTPIGQISPFLLHAVLAHEDASFFVHHGFAPWAIRDALVANLREGRYVRGASTITMQLVKNAFLHREKTLARKVQEVLLTWWVETAMTKEDILELYLNVIELGDGVYGIRDAAQTFFGRSPGELSAAESVYLAMILPNPPLYSAEHRVEGRPPEGFRRRMANFLRHLGETGRYDAAAVAAGLADIETMRFVHPDDPPPPPRALVGSTSALPIGIGSELSFESFDDEEEAPMPADDEPSEEAAEAGWDRWEEVVP